MLVADLRSDTVSKPTLAMREAMARAEVGDDVYGEDPTVNQLQELAAEMLGKEAALFVASGTMGNLAAILASCQRGDEIILGNKAHIFLHEAGGISALGSIHSCQVPNRPDGTLDLDDIRTAIRPDDPHDPITRLVALENTNNRCGGVPLTAEYTQSVGQLARENGLLLHIDGARIFNAAAALGVSARILAAPADSLTFCLSKGLCAPVGSIIVGSRDLIHRAHRIRKQLGGGMRQAGVLAAAGVVALQEMVARLWQDHARARRLGEGLTGMPGLVVDPVYTNMVFVNLDPAAGCSASQAELLLRERGILVDQAGPNRFRLVTHYWIDDKAIEETISAFAEVLTATTALI